MRAITVRQPWAWAIIHGGKDVENRSRNIAGKYRGPVAIHVAQNIGNAAAWTDPNIEAALLEHDVETDWPLTLGRIIGVADLVDVHHADPDCYDAAITDEGWACSKWALYDHQHLVLANPRPLTKPIPWRGQLGLWTLPDDVLAGAL